MNYTIKGSMTDTGIITNDRHVKREMRRTYRLLRQAGLDAPSAHWRLFVLLQHVMTDSTAVYDGFGCTTTIAINPK